MVALDVPEDLFERLRMLRLEISREREVPAYVIFNDATLHEMAQKRPTTRATMMAINGVGEKRFESYGDRFIDAVAGWLDDRSE